MPKSEADRVAKLETRVKALEKECKLLRYELGAQILQAAKDIQDILAIQTRYAQTQMQSYALQAQELSRLMAEAAQNFQPKS